MKENEITTKRIINSSNTSPNNGGIHIWYKKRRTADKTISVYINDIPYPESLLIRYDPKSVEDIPIEANLNEIIQKKVVFVAIDPTDTRLKGRTTVAAMELNDNIEKFFNRTVNGAFTIEQANYTVRTCENTGGTEAVIKLQLGEENKIFKEGSCVVVEGKTEEDLIRGADRLFLRLLGIMPK
ncbi:hypothetical protein J4430_02555 [Candidatus Woesearchaeota archaeon]|nr:hypothetical protein [Candidatus Woesearchaeota archaeon]